MEDIFNQAYQPPPATYGSITVPANYSVTAIADVYIPGATDVEKLVVTVRHHSRNILVLETLRAGP